MKNKNRTLSFATCMAIVMTVTGCGENIEKLGEKTDTSSDVVLVNNTERTITGISISEGSEETFGKNMVTEELPFRQKKKESFVMN